MPSWNEMYHIMNDFTLAYKGELAMSTFITMLLWTSISEILLFVGTFITFCAAPLRMGVVALMIFHLPRGVFGGMLAYKLPRSHDVIKVLPLEADDTDSIATLQSALKFNVSVEILSYAKADSKWLRLYTLSTVVCFLVDSVNLTIQYRWFIDSTSDHTNVWMMAVTIAMIVFDVLYVVYMLSLQRQLPPYVTKWMWEAVFGDTSKLEKVLHASTGERANELDQAIIQLAEQKTEEQRVAKESREADKERKRSEKENTKSSKGPKSPREAKSAKPPVLGSQE